MSIGSRVKVLAMATLFATPAATQDEIVRQRVRPGQENTVQSTISMSLPFDPAKDVEVQHEDALRALYKVAARSCAMVIETVADQCEVASMTSSVRSDETGSRSNRIMATGQIVMKVTFKADTSASP